MSAFAERTARPSPGLLEASDPAPATVIRGTSAHWFIVSDHASNAVPAKLSQLGLTASALASHIGWDIGMHTVARRVAARLGATLVEAGFSRLVIDCNRYPEDPASIPETSGGIAVPGNRGLSARNREQRIDEILVPYQRTVAAELEGVLAAGGAPVFLSLHSCTPHWQGQHRPWDIGISWSVDERVARPVIECLQAREDLCVGDNQPYTLDIGIDFTTPEHAMRRGLAHLQVEFRQDLIADPEGAIHWADVFVDALVQCQREHRGHWQRETPCATQGLPMSSLLTRTVSTLSRGEREDVRS
ncbi:N-formylglutamate amidohydrolase [Pandoraea anhela]|uniref:N-formylglutamate amidohydrolase n=1 Tax=Pandoraea anhela TaxID=2508295 RepID=A0A5E4Y692_9BURK|nr:N-formylglutamate amidohydrolase [Pandoraea anhela]VVE44084.1 hypothetical protein PAN31108_04311 [Pandoraea anhela]